MVIECADPATCQAIAETQRVIIVPMIEITTFIIIAIWTFNITTADF